MYNYEDTLQMFWDDIPVGKDHAVDYEYLCRAWGYSERTVRHILHVLSAYDNGDDYVLIRSSKGKGFYKSDDADEIAAYKAECLHRGRSVFAPIKKINRVLNNNGEQYSLENNLRTVREKNGMKQTDVCERLKIYGVLLDPPLLSKMENGFCAPTPVQLIRLSMIYGVSPCELVNGQLYETR